MKVGIATLPFIESFQDFFPNIRMVRPQDVSKYDLIIFSGGADIEPSIYGQVNNGLSYTSPERDRLELAVLDAIGRAEKKPKILGVCRGHQLVNAYFGGELVQHIDNPHPAYHFTERVSDEAFDEEVFPYGMVNSLHHQGVIKAGKGQRVLSMYEGVVESTISEAALTVQYHPEFMSNHRFFDFVRGWVNPK